MKKRPAKKPAKSSSQPKFGSPAWNAKYHITPFKKGRKSKKR